MRPFWGFLAGFVGSFLGICFLFQMFGPGFFQLDVEVTRQVLVILLSSAFFFGLVMALSVELNRNREIDAFATEVSDGLGHLSRAARLLRHRAFLPLWASAFLAAAGVLTLRGAVAGALPLLAGQALWFLSRFRLYSFLDKSTAVPVALEGPLRAILLVADLLFALSAWPLLDTLSAHGELESRLTVLAASLGLGAALAYAWLRARRSPLDASFPGQALAAAAWACLLLLSLNYALDFRPPVELGSVSKRECLDRRQKILMGQANGTGDPGLYRACRHFDADGETYPLDQAAVTVEYPGALGLRWRRSYLPKAR